MKLETKLNIGDDIFYLSSNKVQQEKVQDIKISVITSKGIPSVRETHILYFTDTNVSVNEVFSFNTKQELLNSL